ncbi:autotransporter domain-containing protein [Ensifer sp.]|uniref:autotransporter domain-containing protein n=1 Tax=Ensifer sp. TaxID=1872086 RepID=UPI002896650A|nr:autotransporter domain-containing protein [Ensifer sp.]
MKKNRQTAIRVAAFMLSTVLPSLSLAQAVGDPRDPQTWRTPEFTAQWGLAAVHAEYAYTLGYDGRGIKVGVVDTGLDITHPEFAGRYGEGVTYDPSKPWYLDLDGHGTAVASIIAANRDGVGMHGIAPGASIVQVGAFHELGYIDDRAAEYGIRKLVDQGVKIINNSYGLGSILEFTAADFEAWRPGDLATYRYAVAHDALIIFGAANDGAAQPSWHAGLPYLFPELERGWLAVVAAGPSDMPYWSNGCGVAMNWCLAAPGGADAERWNAEKGEWEWVNPQDNIMVAATGGGYVREFGTSLAAPFVAGAAALVAQAFPYMTMDQVRQVLLGTATDYGDPGVDPIFGYGMVSAGWAVRGPGKFDWGDFQAAIEDGQSVWSNDITGAGGLIKSGDGVLILAGDSTYQGATSVKGGALAIGGSIASNTFIEWNGTLSGNGVIHGDVDNAGAVIAGFGYVGGTLTVNGDYRQREGSGLLVHLEAPQGTSRLDVLGEAVIEGGEVAVRVAPGSYKGDSRHTILSALGGVSGRFAEDCGCYAFLDLSLSYDPENVYLDVVRNDLAFASVAATRNGVAAATAVERLGIGGLLHDLAMTLDGDAAAELFGQLPGEVYGATVSGLMESSQLIGNQMNDRLRSAFETVGADALPVTIGANGTDSITTASIAAERYGAWSSAFGSWSDIDGDGNAAALSRSTGGFVAGIDGMASDEWRLGFLAGYSHSNIEVDDLKSSTSSDNYHLGIYGGRAWEALSFRSGLAYTWSEIDSRRVVASPALTDSLTGDYSAGTAQLFGELGYGMAAGNIAFEPFASLAFVNVDTSDFSEKGGAAALSVRGSSHDMTFTTLGLRASTDFDFGDAKATARGLIGWRHALGDVTPGVAQALSGSEAFSVTGAPLARDNVVLEAGVEVAITREATLGISYQGQIASTARDHGVRADLAIRF